jgi:hypothetical protein
MNTLQNKSLYLDFLALKKRYQVIKQQSLQREKSKIVEWPFLLKVWVMNARRYDCQFIQIIPLSQKEFRLKIQGTFLGLKNWLKITHNQLPDLKINKVVIMQQSQNRLQMVVHGYNGEVNA